MDLRIVAHVLPASARQEDQICIFERAEQIVLADGIFLPRCLIESR